MGSPDIVLSQQLQQRAFAAAESIHGPRTNFVRRTGLHAIHDGEIRTFHTSGGTGGITIAQGTEVKRMFVDNLGTLRSTIDPESAPDVHPGMLEYGFSRVTDKELWDFLDQSQRLVEHSVSKGSDPKTIFLQTAKDLSQTTVTRRSHIRKYRYTEEPDVLESTADLSTGSTKVRLQEVVRLSTVADKEKKLLVVNNDIVGGRLSVSFGEVSGEQHRKGMKEEIYAEPVGAPTRQPLVRLEQIVNLLEEEA